MQFFKLPKLFISLETFRKLHLIKFCKCRDKEYIKNFKNDKDDTKDNFANSFVTGVKRIEFYGFYFMKNCNIIYHVLSPVLRKYVIYRLRISMQYHISINTIKKRDLNFPRDLFHLLNITTSTWNILYSFAYCVHPMHLFTFR